MHQVNRSSCPLIPCTPSRSVVKPFATSPIAQQHFLSDCTDKSLTTIYIFVSEGDSLQLNSLLRNNQFLWAPKEFLLIVFPNLILRLLTLLLFSTGEIRLYQITSKETPKPKRQTYTQFKEGRRVSDMQSHQTGTCNVFVGEAQLPVSRTADQYFPNAQHSLQKMHIMDDDWAQDSIVIF